MSDERRKNARLQGKFSDPKEFRRRDKQSEKKQNQNSSKNKEENTKSRAFKLSAVEGIQYDETSNCTFEELSDKKPIQEIRQVGVTHLSETDNGTSRIIYETNFLSGTEADELMIILKDSTEWYSKNIVIYGQEVPQPRLVAWYGPFPYAYSGAMLEPAEMPSFVIDIKHKVEMFLKKHNLNVDLNSVLLNYYRNGKDSVAWHSDDEPTMGIAPTIASVSLGEIRAFQMRPKPHVDIDPETIFQVNLLPGSLLIMDGSMQQDWQHRVPKEYNDRGPRINLTFRTVSEISNTTTQVPYTTIESAESIYKSKVALANPAKVSQANPVYDSENFPPLMSASNSNSNVSSKTNSQSKSKNNSLHQKDSVNCEVAAEEKSATDSRENNKHSTRNLNSLSHDTTINNLPDITESSKSEVSPNVEDNAGVEAEAKGDYDDLLEVGPSEDKDLNSFKHSVPSCNMENEETEAGCSSGIKYKLNVNAPDFVPGSPFTDPVNTVMFEGYNLRQLVDFNSANTEHNSKDFLTALINGVKDIRDRNFFYPRDWIELDVYEKLSECDLDDNSQKVVSDRICSMVKNALSCKGKNGPNRTRGRYYNNRGNSRY